MNAFRPGTPQYAVRRVLTLADMRTGAPGGKVNILGGHNIIIIIIKKSKAIPVTGCEAHRVVRR
jgi:hypothetical protein